MEPVCCTPHPTKPLLPGWEPPVPWKGAGMSLHSEPQTGKPSYRHTHQSTEQGLSAGRSYHRAESLLKTCLDTSEWSSVFAYQ